MNQLPKHHYIPVRDETQTNYIVIDEGPFKEVIFRFGQVSFNETADGLRVDYVYEVKEPGDHTITSLEQSPEFREVLNSFMDAHLKSYNSYLQEKKG